MNQADFTPYAHSAAGHEGLSSNASGSLIIKPCTQAEIEFYESAKDHPEFQAHMPTYMGKLMLNNDPQVQALANTNASNDNDNDNVTAVGNAVDVKQLSGLKVEDGELKTNSPTVKITKDWVPSGGKKLSTGLGIVLENATTGFKKPNVLDLKLGSRLWADDAPEEKRKKLDQVAAETTTGSLGFRVAGMKVWQGDDSSSSSPPSTQDLHTTSKENYKSYDKFYGRSLTPETITSAFIAFVGGQPPSTTTNTDKNNNTNKFTRPSAPLLLNRLLTELNSIKYVLESTESRMYSASILVVLEGDDKALSHALEAEKIEKLHEETDGIYEDEDEDEDDGDGEEFAGPRVLEVRLIDFAHAQFTPGLGPDENALKGVRSIIGIVERLLDSYGGEIQ